MEGGGEEAGSARGESATESDAARDLAKNDDRTEEKDEQGERGGNGAREKADSNDPVVRAAAPPEEERPVDEEETEDRSAENENDIVGNGHSGDESVSVVSTETAKEQSDGEGNVALPTARERRSGAGQEKLSGDIRVSIVKSFHDKEESNLVTSAKTEQSVADRMAWLEAVRAEDAQAEDDEILENLTDEIENYSFPDDDAWNATYTVQKSLETTRDSIKKMSASNSLGEFERKIDGTKLKLASISKEDAIKRLASIQAKRNADKAHIRRNFVAQQVGIAARERAARLRVLETSHEKHKLLREHEKSVALAAMAARPSIRREFEKHEQAFRQVVARQEAEITERFGTLSSDSSYCPRQLVISTSQRHVPCDLTIQPQWLCGVKDKLPRGRYCFAGFVLDELGGAVLRYSKTSKLSVSESFHHGGHFSDSKINLGATAERPQGSATLRITCPPSGQLDLSFAIVLQIYSLGRIAGQEPQEPVGFCVLPLACADGSVVSGNFRLPVLKGRYDARFDRYFKLEQSIAHDLSSWLCNLYVSVSVVQRCQQPLVPIESDCNSIIKEKPASDRNSPQKKARSSFAARFCSMVASMSYIDRAIRPVEQEKERPIKPKGETPEEKQPETLSPPQARVDRSNDGASALPLSEFEYALVRNPCPQSALDVLTKVAWGSIRRIFSRVRLCTNQCWLQAGAILLAFWLRMLAHYVGQYVYLTQGGYASVIAFQVLPFRCTLHYPAALPLYHLVGVMFAGTASCVAVFWLLVATEMLCQQIATWTASANLVSRSPPEAASTLVLCFGLFSALDPLLILVVDLVHDAACSASAVEECFSQSSACLCSESEAWRLVLDFVKSEGSAMNGIYLVMLLYSVLIASASAMVLLYFVFTHRTGRAQDLYRRLCLTENAFFVPGDDEVASTYVSLAQHRARHWEGPSGARREVNLVEDSGTLEILQVSPRGKTKELWRAFYKMPNGSIIEPID